MTQTEYYGADTLFNLERILDEKRPKKVFLVTGNTSYKTSGADKIVDPILEKYKVVRFSEFSPNPKLEEIQKGAELFGDSDLIIAIGGGSAIDSAKTINALVSNPNISLEDSTNKVELEKVYPLIAVPTTSGTGSEATHFAVLYVDGQKRSVSHPLLLPNYSILDYKLTMKLPKRITANTGMDAFCQAVESYWSVNSTIDSRHHAEQAMKLIVKYLPDAVNIPTFASRAWMAKAANLAGKAIDVTRTTAPHAMSYPITSKYGVAHGHAVALTLGSVFDYNYKVTEEDVLHPKGVSFVTFALEQLAEILGFGRVKNVKPRISRFMNEIGLETKLSELGIDDIEFILDNINAERVVNNPRKLTREAAKEILEGLI